MPLRIEDYALIGNLRTAALVGKDGSIDWLCLPRFDAGACFASLLGGQENGFWKISPTGSFRSRRAYRPGTLILETEFETDGGVARVTDFMVPNSDDTVLVRIVEGVRGCVEMAMRMRLRFDYGSVVPWVQRKKDKLVAIAGPDTVHVRMAGSARPREGFGGDARDTHCEFKVRKKQRLAFILNWHESHLPHTPRYGDPVAKLGAATRQWRRWSARCRYRRYAVEAVHRSLITLKAMTHARSGALVAAVTTSLPEKLEGVRNWDYRFCWLRDATFSLDALMAGGYVREAKEWQQWLLRAIAGMPEDFQILYGISGERRTTEMTLPWLAGHENSRPVRIGNQASTQFQLDVFGEMMDVFYLAQKRKLVEPPEIWNLQTALLTYLEKKWVEPDHGIWEVRGPPLHFTHSKVMAWVAFDRALRMIDELGLEGPRARWHETRRRIHDEVCERGFNAARGTFVQSYESEALDASLLMLPLVGFLPATDPRMRRTIEAIEKTLTCDGFVLRYHHGDAPVDGLPPGEGVFLACSFWLVNNLCLLGRKKDARKLFDRLLALRNDVGLFSEEYDPAAKRMLGNFPQAFSHVALINSACYLSGKAGIRPLG